MTAWHHDPANAQLVDRLRNVVAGQGRLLVFLGAGLSFGAARINGRATFDYDHYDRWWPHDFPHIDLVPDRSELPKRVQLRRLSSAAASIRSPTVLSMLRQYSKAR